MNYRYIDIHTHTNFAAFEGDRAEAIRRAQEAGVALINVGTQKDTSQKAVEIAEKYENGVYATVGLHPIHTAKSFHNEEEIGEGGKEFTSHEEQFDYEYYKKLAIHTRVVAIGECGLDFYRQDAGAANVRKQEEVFRKQIELAIEIKKPLMLHIRKAYKEAYDILKSYTGIAGNLHFFSGTPEEARPFLDKGFSFSFTGVITFARSYDSVICYIPLNRIMSETDAPFVAPAPYRGKRNEPAYVIEVVKKIAEIRNEDHETVRAQLLKNAEQFFGISLAR
ncbi:MAG: hypothetical protein A3C08_00915 [Candidatus Taylorbacteria bacterium RIFCSPHIGHO2_02_FULL_47_18]|uniref:Hydrolase TatD n=1 Tax=Candidatus Taylorbacteria bacterium RIFCSPLOWO2_01_FULL_48_100 TaxID=1802322 RepID=A0A1G2NEV6_9BACT|nr:MAG: hypothetical protein A2670_03040 [Candidatus Taylorbacteria bacterium RIFCSPHIGHO2_01_FULL_48_38]OHA27530.1 MAG: hypothetical protein A3C08_00915 [Candidatus Taylorbacteria bacterium RIFCSPHIGHO2_02_FULL_47_18]OHA34594.1 MAG: hypothetical protein A2938_03535 [Candidatus Taylorbacteria bacterium RIFCSPLOWO2_01_FULL_48_100]OHA40357.1 MAG: hypothetical protein A3J31_02010 [Candidatus Taylorbacteria bacterium RIFCSPLOWO2_02_FULL_48_16]OHA45218.1 MAG: hypothetical protein A3H13_02485 [Candid